MTCTEERFYYSVRDHEMEILRDDGENRHIRFRNPRQKWCYWFELVTWPGALVIRGDMGSWMFSREPDMFGFFGMSEQHRDGLREGKTLAINPQYWAEKIIARDRGADFEEFSADIFAQTIKHRYVEHIRQNMRGEEFRGLRKQLREAIEELLNEHADGCDGREAISAAYDFRWKAPYEGMSVNWGRDDRPSHYKWADFSLEDFWEIGCRDYTHHYIWNLYAIVWGIWHYNQRKDYVNFWRNAA
jgi:hypothetical protein